MIYLSRIPKIGETIIGGDSQIIYGGKGANQAVASNFAGADVKFITQLGNDTFGESLKNHFNELGFEQKYILPSKNSKLGNYKPWISK